MRTPRSYELIEPQMESYVPFQVILTVFVVVSANFIQFPENTEPPSTTTELDTKLVIGLGNEHGHRRHLEIRVSDIPKANLSSLTSWLEYMDQLKTFLQDVKTKNPEEFRLSNAPPGPMGYEYDQDVPREQKVEASLKLVEEFEQKIEAELRKPEKDWNYSVEKE